MACIKRSLKEFELQEKTDNSTIPSIGCQSSTWETIGMVDMALYEMDNRINTNIAKYSESTHTGLTYTKGIKKDLNRLVYGDSIYTVESVNDNGRMSHLILKEVSNVK